MKSLPVIAPNFVPRRTIWAFLITKKYGKWTQKLSNTPIFFWHKNKTKTPLGLPKQQVIICQNVLIYFRKFDQRDILAYFVQNLDIGGYVLLAPNEAMFWQHPNMRRVDNGHINAWQKISQ